MGNNEVRLYKNGNSFGIETSCECKMYFLNEVADKLSDLIESGAFRGDWAFQLSGLLQHVVDICNEYKDLGDDTGGVVIGSGDTTEENLIQI